MSNNRNYYTTGVYAAAAAKAAAKELLIGFTSDFEEVALGENIVAPIPIIENYGESFARWAAVKKEGGTDADVTKGVVIRAAAETISTDLEEGIVINGGRGVGTVTEPGLTAAVGEAAINPVPGKMIKNEVNEIRKMTGHRGCLRITISVDNGETIAVKTFNPKLGITGGISIIGTTGLVRPMSEESWKESLLPQIDMALAAGFDKLVLVFGNMGEKAAVELGFARRRVIQISNFVGYMLKMCRKKGIKEVIIIGHLGKMIKVAEGHVNTHSRKAPQNLDIILSLIEREKLPAAIIRGAGEAKSAEAIIRLLLPFHQKGTIFDGVAEMAEKKLRNLFSEIKISIAVTDLAGNVVGTSSGGARILDATTGRQG